MRGKNFSRSEQDDIRILHEKGYSVRKIAYFLNRSKSGVHDQIERMRADGTIGQQVMELGRFDDKE